MRKYIALLCLTSFLVLNNSQAQDGYVEADKSFAESLYQAQNFRPALKEYLRVYYQDREGEYTDIQLRIAQCFQQTEDLTNAIKYVNQYLRSRKLSGTARADAYYYKIQLLLLKDVKLAIAELLQLPQSIINLDEDRYHYYSAMSYFMDDNFEEGDVHLRKLSFFKNLSSNDYEALRSDMLKNKNKNHLASRLLSVVVPGLGQVVNGEVQDGINSAIINGSMIWIFFYVAKKLSFADALLSVTPYFGRFFVGGMKNANLASQRKQARKKKEYLAELNHLITEAQGGIAQ